MAAKDYNRQMTGPMKTSPVKTSLAIAAIVLVLLLSACGNKGSLVRPADVPPTADSGG